MVLLSFDIEEFDLPTEYGREISINEQLDISAQATYKIVDLLDKHNIKATFYSTVVFAQNNTDLIHKIVASGHEIASHGISHSNFENNDISKSKEILSHIVGGDINGYRSARLSHFNHDLLVEAGYKYNSSMNPTYIPGRYNNLMKNRSLYQDNGIFELPASVSPIVRLPLFWLMFHNTPLCIYKLLSSWTYSKDGYLNIYFHPWEFSQSLKDPRFAIPSFITRNSGDKMITRLDNFIAYLKRKGCSFSTTSDFLGI